LGQETAVKPVDGTIAGPTSQPEPASGRALAVVRRPPRPQPTHVPGAPFLAQLIACAQGAPQTRERRRAEPQEAATAYALALAAVPLEPARSCVV
jgi:hypothetical protein